ncbi:MAG: aldo/keto reductase [Proteobacteria bacterium]|nr:aldo/keto reductase [Pseudomonadota bacterium]
MTTRASASKIPLPAAAAGTLLLGGDLEVSRMGFGAMRITGDGIWGPPPDVEAALTVLKRAQALGVNFIDTADAYGPDVSEELIHQALHPYPAGFVVTTKGGMTRQGPNRWAADCRPEHLRLACDASLQRLGIERHELYQLHAVDSKVPYAESVGELGRLQREGKIRHIGVSNVGVEQLAEARAIVKVVSVQNRYNVADRDSEPVLQVCERDGIAFIPWGPLAQRAQAADSVEPRIAALQAVAAQRGISMPQATLAWLLAKSPVMLPIPGTGKLKHLEENVRAAALAMSAKEMQQVG